jgi:hypothetical protein
MKSKKGRPSKKKSPKKQVKICKPNQEINPDTHRCNLKCKHGLERHPNDFKKCRKSCVLPQIRNPSTDRCRKPRSVPVKKRKKSTKTPKRNPVRLVRKIKTPMTQRDCSVCLEPTFTRTFCTGGRRHPLCVDCYYRLLGSRINFCPTCREQMTRRPDL